MIIDRSPIQADGWLSTPGVRQVRSPNHNDRPLDTTIDLLVIHNISLPPGVFGTGLVHDLFLNQLDVSRDPWLEQLAGLRISAHFLIEREGQITQFVSCLQRAWHAGVSSFEGRLACNDFSIGIELEGTDETAFTAVQYTQLVQLTEWLRASYPLTHVRGHSDIAPDRKTDPGPFFDWAAYAKKAGWQRDALPAPPTI